MKAVILYRSKYGACKEIGEKIAVELDITAIPLDKFNGDFSEYEIVILGSGVYAGMIDKEMKLLCSQNEQELLGKRVFFYLSGLVKDEDKLKKQWEENLSKEFLEHLTYKDLLGGRINFPQMGFFEKSIIQLINRKEKFVGKEKMKENVDLIDYPRVQKFILQVKNSNKF